MSSLSRIAGTKFCRSATEKAADWVAAIGRSSHAEAHPRIWSNRELKGIAPLLTGSVVNVSGRNDQDKEGHCYRSYFTRCTEYRITNYEGEDGLCDGHPDSIPLDLEQNLPEKLQLSFDNVFCHTVLEHVFDARLAFANLCAMARRAVIVVVPFLQQEHFRKGSYGDYWRWTPMSLYRNFELEGFRLSYSSNNENRFYPIYLFAVGTRESASLDIPAERDEPQATLGSKFFRYGNF